MSDRIIDLNFEQPSKGPFLYEAAPEDRAYLHFAERELLELGREAPLARPLNTVGESAYWYRSVRCGRWVFQMLNIEQATEYTTPGSTVFSLFKDSTFQPEGCHFVLGGETRTNQRAISYIAPHRELPPTQPELQQRFAEFRHDTERIRSNQAPHEFGYLLRKLVKVHRVHS